MAFTSVILILLVATTCVFSQNNTTQLDYRLPNIYRPSGYGLYLNFSENAFTAGESSYSGRVNILFQVTEAVSQVKLHASALLRITGVTLPGNTVNSFSVENATEILTINVEEALNPGDLYLLLISFNGTLRTGNTTGIYKSTYQDNTGVTKYLLTTQFQPTSARKTFPCFDEPSLKAIFNVTVDCPLRFTVRSNAITPTPAPILTTSPIPTGVTGATSHKFTFASSPLMSTYLLAIVVSEFNCTEVKIVSDNITHAVCSRNESSQARSWAVEVAPKLLAVFNNYTGINYNKSLAKLYQVAIPDFENGAMENWGLVIYREELLLWDPIESSNRFKQLVATVMSHELAHQWFGNLVTMKWWSELFLNEGLANYFEYFATHQVFPEWQLNKTFVTNTLQRVLRRDNERSSPLQSNVSSPAEIMAKFNEISYLKGGSIFRMVEHMLGSNYFRTGLQAYLRANASGNVVPQDLWRHLQNSSGISTNLLPAHLDVIMRNWTHISGFPLIRVRLLNRTVICTQSTFSTFDNNPFAQWYVPISYTTSADLNKFNLTSPNFWLSPTNSTANITLPNDNAWIILNNQVTGYYRVDYDFELWNRIRAALGTANFGDITEIQRAQIVDDLFHLARVGEKSHSRVFHLIEFLANDTSYFSWTAAFEGFNFLLERVGRESRLGQEITRHLSRLMTNLYQSTPFERMNDTDQIYTLKQGLVLSWACALGHPECIEVSRAFYIVYRLTGQRPNKNLRSLVYCNALRNSSNSREWDFLWNQYLNASIATEKITILSSLGCTRNETLLERYLNKTLRDDSGIRAQDRYDVFASVLNGNSIGIDVALRFLMNNHQLIAHKYPTMSSIPRIIGAIADKILTRNQTDQLRNFMNTPGLSAEYQTAANHSVATAEANLQWTEDFRGHLNDYYQIPNDNNTTNTTTTARPVPAGSASVKVNIYSLVVVSFFSYLVLK